MQKEKDHKPASIKELEERKNAGQFRREKKREKARGPIQGGTWRKPGV